MDSLIIEWHLTVLRYGQSEITFGLLAGLTGMLAATALLLVLLSAWLSARRSRQREQALEVRAAEQEARLEGLLKGQSELTGRLSAMAQNVSEQQANMANQMHERLDGMTGRIGQSLLETTKSTHENLAKLQERLAVIDSAQNNIRSLADEVVELQGILANKQTRGAFGQSRMEAIVQDGLPMGAFEFQATLSNGTRPDCLIRMPNEAPSLVIDAKFPLEAWNQIREAQTDAFRKAAGAQFKRDLGVHIKAIREKYFIPAETQDTAFLFVPSESIFAEIHENFEDIVQTAHRARVVIVSPSLLMLSIQVVQAVLKDTRMRQQAHVIQGEVAHLLEDVNRLDERVRKLAGHFGMAQKDVEMILTSSSKVSRRGNRITELEFEATGEAGTQASAAPQLRAVSGNE